MSHLCLEKWLRVRLGAAAISVAFACGGLAPEQSQRETTGGSGGEAPEIQGGSGGDVITGGSDVVVMGGSGATIEPDPDVEVVTCTDNGIGTCCDARTCMPADEAWEQTQAYAAPNGGGAGQGPGLDRNSACPVGELLPRGTCSWYSGGEYDGVQCCYVYTTGNCCASS